MVRTTPGLRIALFSPCDGMGLGHLRRNLLVLEDLIARGTASEALLISGSHEATVLHAGNGITHLTIPGLRRQDDDTYAPRATPMNLEALLTLRSRAVSAHLESFAPDLFIVDKKPRGILGELSAHLRRMKDNGRTKIVLGLRDILEDPADVAREWREGACFEAIDELYDAVWIYGERRLYDLAAEVGFPEPILRKTTFTGYLDPRQRSTARETDASSVLEETGIGPAPFVLCLVGGGEDGIQLAEQFCAADFPTGQHGVVVSGPFMPEAFRQRLHRQARDNPRLHVLDFLREPAGLVAAARKVICMGGYGTVTEVLAHDKPALVVPRVRPRTEQLIRAECFARHGLIDWQHPDTLNPQVLGSWMNGELQVGSGSRPEIDLGGLERISHLVEHLMASPSGGPSPGITRPAEGGKLVPSEEL